MLKVKSPKSYQVDMCEGRILPILLKFALPLMLSSVLQLLFNAADIVVIGQFCDPASQAAVSSNGSLINLLVSLFLGLSVGSNVLASRYFSSHHDEKLSKTTHTSYFIAIVSGAFLTLIGIIFAPQILILMKTPENVLPLATTYLRIYFGGSITLVVYNFGSALLRSIGDTRRPLYYLVISGVVNVLLNLFFVCVVGIGVAGVAIATVASQTLSAILVTRCLMKESGGIRLYLNKIKADKTILFKIIKIGLPAGLQGTLFSISNVIIQSSVNSFGDIVMAGNADTGNLEGFIYVAMNAFYQAVLSFTGQNAGRRQYKRIVKAQIIGQGCVIVIGFFLGCVLFFFGTPLLRLYTKEQAVIEAGLIRISCMALIYFLDGIMDVFVGTIRGLGYSITPMIVTMLGACVFRVIWIMTVFQIPAYHTLETVYISYPISWILTSLAHFVSLLIIFPKVKKRFPPLAEEQS